MKALLSQTLKNRKGVFNSYDVKMSNLILKLMESEDFKPESPADIFEFIGSSDGKFLNALIDDMLNHQTSEDWYVQIMRQGGGL